MVIRGGKNLYPREIEEILVHHSKVAEAYVVGVPDERFGEELCAWVKLHQNVHVSEEDLRTYCKSQLAHFKVPRYFIFVQDFPTTVTGKVQKFKIREESIKMLHLI